jgi:hypothetical protein
VQKQQQQQQQRTGRIRGTIITQGSQVHSKHVAGDWLLRGMRALFKPPSRCCHKIVPCDEGDMNARIDTIENSKVGTNNNLWWHGAALP